MRDPAFYQPQHYANVAAINTPWQPPQDRLSRPEPHAPNYLMNSAWTAGPAQAAALLGQYAGVAPGTARVPWQGSVPTVAPMLPAIQGQVWPTASGILNQRRGPHAPQQRGRGHEWSQIEQDYLLMYKRQGMTHPMIAETLSNMFNVERTHHMVTKKLAALRREAIKPDVSCEPTTRNSRARQGAAPGLKGTDLQRLSAFPLVPVSAAALIVSWHPS